MYSFLVQATIQKLLEEGVHLNNPAVPPQEKRLCVTEDDPQWIIYRWKLISIRRPDVLIVLCLRTCICYL